MIMLKLIVGNDWKFAVGGGVFYRGSAFSNSTWIYDRVANWDFDSEVPRDPNNILEDLEDTVQFFEATNFGAIADIGVIRPITNNHSLFVEFRYAYPFKAENEIPAFRQQNLTASIGVMTRILKDKETAEKRKKRRAKGGFDF